ncbi:MAG TPA: hypothetical protein VN618_12390 [Solirubrobacteraceae bacterium]|nr:hypothetical protein [Solirubrobacteraceae bacterium]
MGNEIVVSQGMSVWVGDDVQASGYVVEVLEGRRVGRNGPFQAGRVRIRLDATGDEVDVSAADIEHVL